MTVQRFKTAVITGSVYSCSGHYNQQYGGYGGGGGGGGFGGNSYNTSAASATDWWGGAN